MLISSTSGLACPQSASPQENFDSHNSRLYLKDEKILHGEQYIRGARDWFCLNLACFSDFEIFEDQKSTKLDYMTYKNIHFRNQQRNTMMEIVNFQDYDWSEFQPIRIQLLHLYFYKWSLFSSSTLNFTLDVLF